ncbi:hypothetical protein GCM10022255_009670 [Dactylosporangium darangshiense]|uniref:Uncharacterized protein n=1 Tax=Dactylosporangium darangshiense TaxID=579108 RepID=A0ABP8CYE5_9ACTN
MKPHTAGDRATVAYAAALDALHELFVLTGDLEPLRHAMAFRRRSLAGRDPGRLNEFFVLLHQLYRRTGNAVVLTEAIAVQRDATSRTPADHPHAATIRANLGAALYDHFERTGDENALREALETVRPLTDADLHRLASTSPRLVARLRGPGAGEAGEVLEQRYRATGSPEDLLAALAAWRSAAAHPAATGADRVAALHRLATAAQSAGLTDVAANAYIAAVGHLPTIADPDARPSRWPGLATDAAGAAIAAGAADAAVALLEHGRTTMWAQALHHDAARQALRHREPGIADRLDEVRTLLADERRSQ